MELNSLDLNKLHVFRVVAESRSLREASQRLLRTPSAVSQSVSALESRLGIPLFLRRPGKLVLTSAGSKLLRQVRENEARLAETLGALRPDSGLLRGALRVGLPLGFSSDPVLETLSRLLDENPGLQLVLRFKTHPSLAKLLASGELDLALSRSPLEDFSRRVNSLELRRDQLVLAVPPRWKSLADSGSAELPVIDYYQKPLLFEEWLKHHRMRQKVRNVRVYGASLEHVLSFVRLGVGCAVVPRHAVEGELARRELFVHERDRARPMLAPLWMNTRVEKAGQGVVLSDAVARAISR